MTADEGWRVASFSAERASGVLRAGDREVAFSIEAWVPCDPQTARDLEDSDRRRYLLLPRPGEPVRVSWKKNWRGEDVPGRVERAVPLAVAERLPFLEWQRRVGKHLPQLAAWTEDDWRRLVVQVAEDLHQMVFGGEARPPEVHLGLLSWLKANAPEPWRSRLDWLHHEAGPGRVAVEVAGDDEVVHLSLEPGVVARLVAEGLLVPVAAPP